MPDSLYHILEDINGIRFTPRQIDILACIISGRKDKAIASLLSIPSERTVQKHIQAIRELTSYNSKERLIPFVEASGKFSLVKQHYLNILIENEFHKKLQDIKKLVAVENTRCLISYGEPQNQFKPLAKRLGNYLEIIGITAREKLLKQQYKEQSIDKSSAYIHISLPTKIESEIHAEDNTLSLTTLAPSIQQEEYAYIIVVQPANLSEADSNADNLQTINYIKNSPLSITFLDILSQLFPEKTDTIQQIKAGFKTYIDRLQSNEIPLEYTKKNQKKQPFTLAGLRQSLKKSGALRSISLALTSILLCFYVVQGLYIEAPAEIARATILLPPGMLLERSSIITEMNEKLSDEDRICSLALIGIGGCGKTTLAKQFAARQNFSIIGEINAASHDKLLTSFENFAHDLSITDADKKALNEIKELTGNEQKEKRLINFVKERMRYHEKWLIIFDNVEKFSEIQKYYPTSIKEWGRGAVIILTQSDHLKQSPAINHKILISELSSVEKKELFSSIMSAKQPSSLTPVPRTRIEKFLKEIPPFPLDVSLAAHYIMSMNISPDEYLERIQAQNHNFISTQHAIFGAHYDYAKSRFSIITLPLQKIIDDNDSFIEVLFYLCMVDPEGIPRYILDKRLGKELADQLIHSLKQCSLISDQKTPSTFRMHRSTQDILTKYLKAKLDARKIEEFSHPLIAMMEEYTCKIIENEDHQQAKLLLPHLESLAKNNQIFLSPYLIL